MLYSTGFAGLAALARSEPIPKVLELKDFYHLPPLGDLVDRLIAESQPGLVIVAGFDPRPLATEVAGGGFLPSGRAAVFGMLVDAILAARPQARGVVVTSDRRLVRVPRALKRRVEFALVEPPFTYAGRIAEAARRKAGLLVIDRLTEETVPAALAAVQGGARVLSQLDTVFRGAQVARQLLELGAEPAQLGGLAWVLSIQRLPTLCPNCKEAVLPVPEQLARLQERYADLAALLGEAPLFPKARAGARPRSAGRTESERGEGPGAGGELPGEKLLAGEVGTFYRAPGCEACHHLGRQGDVAVFDVYRAGGECDPLGQPSLLPMETYVLYLAAVGRLSLDDYLDFEADQFGRVYRTLSASERALLDAKLAFERKLAELEAANRVLEQRTRSLVSLQDISQMLITSTGLDDLAQRVCRRVRDLCGADRAVLYLLKAPDQAEVLAVGGWEMDRFQARLGREQVFLPEYGEEPAPFHHWPPGIPPRHPDVEGAALRAGLYVPLVAQQQPVGVMVVHSTRKASFTPGETALLRAFANQAALAIQRAALFEQLRAKIAELEAAQVELAVKERMERELELARQVQQRVLPRLFPQVEGYGFAARYEPARQVGGDFYDVIALGPERFGVAIADVSDKGMPAALFMALTRSLLLAEARRERSPRAVLESVNQLLMELSEPSMFVTAFYGVVERASGLLTYARAGHDHPFLIRAGRLHRLEGQGTPLGIFEAGAFGLSEQQVELQAGDRLVLYTDGLVDAMDADGRLFERGRLEALLQATASLPPGRICAAVFEELLAFQGQAEQFDDMAMLVVEVS